MAEQLQKKRKATTNLENRPNKKAQATPSGAKVEHVAGTSSIRPIVASTAGAVFPSDIKFQTFLKKTSEETGSQILLHSSGHPTIDYQAGEGAETGEAHLRHYVAVYDPATNKLQITEAKRLTVRGSIRQQPRADEDEEAETHDATQGTRSALTEAFGSKKSKKAVQAMAENRQLGQGIEGQTIAEAITAHIDPDEEEEDEADATIIRLSNKPIPQPNLQTDDIASVYALSSLIKPSPASNTLKSMPLVSWLSKLKSNKEVVDLRSRFIANRLGYLGKQVAANPDQAQQWMPQLQLLRYIDLLIQIHHFTSKHDRRRRMPWIDEWPAGTLSSGMPTPVLKEIMKFHFPENNTATTHAMTLLRTIILALTLHILPPSGRTGGASGAGHGSQLVAEPTEISLDLALDAASAKKLYQELGCVVKPAPEKDLNVWGYAKLARKSAKGDVPRPSFAVLKFPLSFPKVSSGRKAGGRR